MREHPIPQDITSYKFHIIGSMTLKQFVEIAVGVCLAGLFYTTNLPTVIKYPLMLITGISGGLIAFLPVEERPLDHWIITFIKVMYKPTQFFWKREATIPEVFSYTQNLTNSNNSGELDIDFSPIKRDRIREYLTSVPSVKDPYAFESTEVERMNAILGSFSHVEATQGTPQKAHVLKPNLGVRVRNFRPRHQEKIVYASQENAHAKNTAATDETLTDIYTQRQQLPKQQLSPENVAEDIAIPETELVSVSNLTAQEASQEDTSSQKDQNQDMTFMGNTQSSTQTSHSPQTEASYNANLPFPEPPTEPNKLVGMVLSPQNELIVNAIIEILKPNGTVARAVKTNALGQFFVTTPLENGEYTLTAEKDTFSFEPKRIRLTGSVVQPIEIRSLS